MTNSVVAGRYDDNWLSVVQRGLAHTFERLVKTRARRLVVAAGLIERPYVFEGNDLPGVMLSTAVRRLVNLYAVKPGERAVVLTANGEGDAAAEDLRRVGVDVVARRRCPNRSATWSAPAEARTLEQVELADGQKLDCDLLVTAVGWTAPTSLLNMAGDRPRFDQRAARFVPGGELPPNVLVTGGLAGDGSHRGVGGTRPGDRVARPAGHGAAERSAIPTRRSRIRPGSARARTAFVDFSEDVSSKDLLAAVEEGYDSVELLKRYTTVTMGPAQGKLETVNAVAVLAEALGQSIEETGTTVWRPPYAPITLGALAGRMFETTRYSPDAALARGSRRSPAGGRRLDPPRPLR